MDASIQIKWLETGNEMVEESIKYQENKDFHKELLNNKYLQAFMNGVDEFKKSEVIY